MALKPYLYDGEGGGGYQSDPVGDREPNYSGTGKMQQLNLGWGVPLPIAYGYVRAVGLNVLLAEVPGDKSKVFASVLGGGPWDGIERFWIGRQVLNGSFNDTVHFHPGLLPALGAGLAEVSTGSDQNVDTFFSYLPSTVQRVTFPRMAYVMGHVFVNPNWPTPDLEYFGDYRALKVRQFDASGTQTGFAWSLNPIEQALDLRMRLQLMRKGLQGEEPSAAVKAVIDWAAFADAVAYCNELLANGKPRFQSSMAFTEISSLGEMENKILRTCRGYQISPFGKLQYRIDKARATTFAITRSHLKTATAQFHEKNIEGAKNRLVGAFRDLNPKVVATITSITSDAFGKATVTTAAAHPFAAESQVEIAGTGVAGWDGKAFRVIESADNTHFKFNASVISGAAAAGTCATPESRFAQRSVILDHDAHQKAIGAIGVGIAAQAHQEAETVDFGVSTWDQVWRVLKYELLRNLGPDTQPYKAPMEGEIELDLYAVDDTGRSAFAQYDGDTINLSALASDEFTGDYEIGRTDIDLGISSDNGGEGGGGTAKWSLREYVPSAFVDVSDEEPVMTPVPQGSGIPGVSTLEGDGSAYKARTALHSNAAPTTNPVTAIALAGTAGKFVVDPFVMRAGVDISCLSASYEITSAAGGGAIQQGQSYKLFYDDEYFQGGEITPQATQDESVLKASPFRFVITQDWVTVPLAGPSSETVRPSTYQNGGDVATVNPTKAFDGIGTTFAAVRSAYSSPDGFDCSCTWYGFAARTVSSPSSIHLKIDPVANGKSANPINLLYSLNGGVNWTNCPGYPTAGSLSTPVDIPLPTTQATENIRVQAYTGVPTGYSTISEIDLYDIRAEIS